MKAIVYRRGGGPDVLELTERPLPQPGAGEVRVKVAVSGVNPTDWKARAGTTLPFPEIVPNQDGAGVIDGVGAGVHLSVGQRVWIWEAAWQRSNGTAQEYVVVPEPQAVPLPADASDDLGASLGIPALTAHRCLTVSEAGPTRLTPGALDGRTVLVAGGAGAVGHAAIQLARWSGATVLTTVSSEVKSQLALAAGAHHAINYRTHDARDAVKAIVPQGVDLIVEVAPTANAQLDSAVVARHATVAIYANDGGDSMMLPVRANMTPNTRYQFVLVYTMPGRAKQQAVEDVRAAVAAGVLAVGEHAGLPLHHFALEDTGAAHRAVEDGVVGKVLIDVARGELIAL